MEINKIYNENCLDTMVKMPDNLIDLTVTSPPYDNLRDYKGYSFAFEDIAKELFRVTKQGCIVVWVVGDATKNGSESGTSFKQALYFMSIGFNLHDTMIFRRKTKPLTHKRYEQEFEYMFIFAKGKPNTFNALKVPCNNAGSIKNKQKERHRDKNGIPSFANGDWIVNDMKIKGNVWEYLVGNTGMADKIAFEHPAIFPEQLANDHIISWSNENDLIYDPFMGSGTTAKMAILNKRNYIGSEISKEYCEIAEQRLKMCGGLFFNSFETELSKEAGQ
jgi:DNA modification methylase